MPTAQQMTPDDTEVRTYRVLDELPKRMGVLEMCLCFGQDNKPLDRSTFHRYARQGLFDRFELLPRIGRRAWSGELVAKYLRGEPTARLRSKRTA